MDISTSSRCGRKLTALGAILALCGLSGLAQAERTTEPQAANALYAAPLAKLQVTGTAEKFSIDADHADAQSVLKALFHQANAQFTADNNVVVGQVTMHLSNQSFSTTLDAVCKSLLIRYHKDAKGIYVFEQDTQAIKAAIMRIKDLDALLRQQLRTVGLSLPEDGPLDMVTNGVAQRDKKVAGVAQNRGSLSAGSGFGGGAGSVVGRGGGEAGAVNPNTLDGARRTQVVPSIPNRSVAKEDASSNGLAANLNYLTARDLADIFGLNPQNNNELQNPDNYRAYLQQNGLVYINTGGQKAVVTDVLQELGRQSNTRILIDPSVPTGPKFNLQGHITPRTLPEALNVLTQATRLNWRWLGSSVYVSAMPDFQIFFNSTWPRVIFGSNAYPTSQAGGQGQQNTNPGYGLPSQPPLPITNGEKKTP